MAKKDLKKVKLNIRKKIKEKIDFTKKNVLPFLKCWEIFQSTKNTFLNAKQSHPQIVDHRGHPSVGDLVSPSHVEISKNVGRRERISSNIR